MLMARRAFRGRLVGYVVGLAAIATAAPSTGNTVVLTAGIVQTCFSYVVLKVRARTWCRS